MCGPFALWGYVRAAAQMKRASVSTGPCTYVKLLRLGVIRVHP